MSLLETIKAEMKTAMKAKDKVTVSVLRNLQSAIKNQEIEKKEELDEAAILAVLQKQIKQRQDSLKIYVENDRADLAENEQAEIDALQKFMPEQLSEEEILELVEAEIAAQGATSMKDMGKVMGALKAKTSGKADPAVVSKLIKAKLG